MSGTDAVRAAETGPAVPTQSAPTGDGGPPPSVWRGLVGGQVDEDDTPLPDLPPLPADPRWRVEHLPMVTAVGLALVCCAASVGLLVGGPTTALGAAAGVLVVTVGATMSTLVIAWADVVRPALVLPVGLAAYVTKYALIAFIMIAVGMNGWAGGRPMAWGIAGGAVTVTAAQAWWLLRSTRRRAAGPPES